jgi:hypothetical protein
LIQQNRQLPATLDPVNLSPWTRRREQRDPDRGGMWTKESQREAGVSNEALAKRIDGLGVKQLRMTAERCCFWCHFMITCIYRKVAGAYKNGLALVSQTITIFLKVMKGCAVDVFCFSKFQPGESRILQCHVSDTLKLRGTFCILSSCLFNYSRLSQETSASYSLSRYW